MVIGLGPNVTFIPAGQPDNSDLSERQRRSVEPRERVSPDNGNPADANNQRVYERRVEALQAAEDGRLKRQREQEELPRESQLALELYRNTQTNPNGRDDDGELAGINVFV